MEFAELVDTVSHDAPTENLLVDIGQRDAGGEKRKISVALNERLRVEFNRLAEVGGGDFVEQAAAELGLDGFGRHVDFKAREGVGDTLAEVFTVPEESGAIGVLDEQERVLVVVDGHGGGGFLLALLGAHRAVENVGFGDLVVALAHQFGLDDILDLFDADDVLATQRHRTSHGGGDALSGSGIETEREE